MRAPERASSHRPAELRRRRRCFVGATRPRRDRGRSGIGRPRVGNPPMKGFPSADNHDWPAGRGCRTPGGRRGGSHATAGNGAAGSRPRWEKRGNRFRGPVTAFDCQRGRDSFRQPWMEQTGYWATGRWAATAAQLGTTAAAISSGRHRARTTASWCSPYRNSRARASRGSRNGNPPSSRFGRGCASPGRNGTAGTGRDR